MLRHIRPHSLGIVAATAARPNNPQKSTELDTSNDADSNSNKQALAILKEDSSLTTRATNGNFTSPQSEDKRNSIHQSQRVTDDEATCTVHNAEIGFENGSTNSKFEVIIALQLM